MIHTYGNCSFDDADGTVYEREPRDDDSYNDYMEDHFRSDEDGEDIGELVNVTETVKKFFEKENL